MGEPSERRLREIADPDFGTLELWETRSKGAVSGQPMREIVLLDWRGALGTEGLSFVIGCTDEDADAALAALGAEERAILRQAGARRAAWTERAASAMLRVARDWAEDPALTQSALAAALRLDEITYDDMTDGGALTLWFTDTADIFAGHGVMAQLDRNGDIASASLQG